MPGIVSPVGLKRLKQMTMKTIRTAGTGAPFTIVRDLNDYALSNRKRKRISRRKRKALKALEKQTF